MRVITPQTLLAGDISAGACFVRAADAHLEVGDTHGMGVLSWPRTDDSETVRWLLSLKIEIANRPALEIDVTLSWMRGSGGPKVETVSQDRYREN